MKTTLLVPTLTLGGMALLAPACGPADPGDSPATSPGDDPVGPVEEGAVTAPVNRDFTCLQTSTGRAAYKQKITGQLDANSAPLDVQIFRGPTLKLEHQAAVGVLVPDYSGGYFKTTYHLDAYSLGSEGINDYYLLLPESGVTGATFGAQLHLLFNHGNFGWWQKTMSCTVP